MAQTGGFHERDHPRAGDGRFADKGKPARDQRAAAGLRHVGNRPDSRAGAAAFLVIADDDIRVRLPRWLAAAGLPDAAAAVAAAAPDDLSRGDVEGVVAVRQPVKAAFRAAAAACSERIVHPYPTQVAREAAQAALQGSDRARAVDRHLSSVSAASFEWGPGTGHPAPPDSMAETARLWNEAYDVARHADAAAWDAATAVALPAANAAWEEATRSGVPASRIVGLVREAADRALADAAGR